MIARRLPLLVCAAFACLPGVAAAQARADLTLPLPPGAEGTAHATSAYDSIALPVGPWIAGKMSTIALKGAIAESAWRLPGSGADTLRLIESLAAGLGAQGFAPIFSCETDGCGGFDFRYALRLLPEPQMHVDLGDFRYLAFVRGKGEDADYASLMVSRAGDTGFVQLTVIGGAAAEPPPDPSEPPPAAPAGETGNAPAGPRALLLGLDRSGRVVLEDLSFASGSAELGPGRFASLAALAAYLAANPDSQVAIVGHTDASGALAANIALSKQRAESVVSRLIEDYGAAPAQLTAEGVGYLAPLAPNLTEEGRQKNRRVEAVLTSTR